MNTVIEKLKKYKVVPVIAIEKEEDALPLGEVLLKSGLPIAEITFRTTAAEGAIKSLKNEFPDLLIGAGTLLTTDQIQKAADAGTDFFVSPGFNPKNVEYALKKGLLFTPGVTNPSLVEMAMDMGLKNLKFFPASAAGGTGMLKAMNAVYPDVSFIPTGGITSKNIKEYLALPNVIACGGSWMVKKDLISGHKWDEIATLVQEAVETVK